VYVSITRTDTSELPVDTATIVGEEMERWLRDMEGFEGLMLLARPGETLGLAFWASEEIAQRHAATRAEFRERMISIAGARIESVEGYDVAFSRLGPGFGQERGEVG
jgi:hypothetical protein